MKKELYEVKAAQFNLTKSLRLDSEMVKELMLISQFKKIPPGTLMRLWIQDRIQSFQNNAGYKRWKKALKKEEKKCTGT